MKVLFLTFHLPRPSEPGAARPWEELQMMRALGWDVVVVTASGHYLTGDVSHPVRGLWRRDTEDGVTIYRTWFPRDYRRSTGRRLLGYMSYSLLAPLAVWHESGVDVVFAGTDPPFMTPGAWVLSRITRSALVLDERDVYPEHAEAVGMAPPKFLVRLMLVYHRWLLRQCRRVVTVSPGLRKLLIERGADPHETYVIPNYFPSESAPKYAHGPEQKPTDQFTVLYAGSLGQHTSVETCLKAAETIQNRGYNHVHFVFLGAGERVGEYRAMTHGRGIHNVRFEGTVPRNQMPGVYATAHVTIHALSGHPYLRLALSSKIFDYLSHGKPVVFAGNGDIADVLQESGAGISVQPYDHEAMAEAIIRLYEHPEERKAMGDRGRPYIQERFSRDQLIQSVMQAVGGESR